MKTFLEEVKKLAYAEVERTGMPLRQHVDLSYFKGIELAKKLNANVDVVAAGTLLMDCMIGQALQENRLADHVQMSLDKANELLEKSSLSEEDKENIRHCITQHHGAEKFYSLESEICCNADCYRFASIEGFMYAARYLRDMPFEGLVKLLKDKTKEKQNLISLEVVKKELEPQYRVVNNLLAGL